MEIRVFKLTDKDFPSLLRETSNPPEKIFVRGKLPDANKICIAIVGTRKATSEGRALAKKIGKMCAQQGYVVVSGLAMGIDTAAHEGALEGGGETIAVLGCGIDTIYPAQNENLAKKILSDHGAIISEYPAGIPAYQNQFLERNRIVAGLSIATIVIEAPAKSGALVTARLAAEYGREVLVFPGMAGHPQYRGSHALIRDGARLVNSFEDITEDLERIIFEIKSSFLPTPQLLGLEKASMETESSENKRGRNYLSQRTSPTERLKPDGLAHIGARILSAAEGERGRSVVSELAGRVNGAREMISSDAQLILSKLSKSKTPLSVDNIVELTNLQPQTVNRELSELLIGRIIEEDGFGFKLITKVK